jgi:hypothetical protein
VQPTGHFRNRGYNFKWTCSVLLSTTELPTYWIIIISPSLL